MANWELYGTKCNTAAACSEYTALNGVQHAKQRKAWYFHVVTMSLQHHTGFAVSPEWAQKWGKKLYASSPEALNNIDMYLKTN